ncbi:MAG: flagellar hook-length control protein FliK, partial [Desulfobacteraceae bacterium]|nr:flagellar hook-length control protein FliK [Desulfobacteraceae bacterium]
MLQGNQLKADDLKSGNVILDKLIVLVSKELKGLEGVDFLKKLKEFFMMVSGNDLSTLTMDEQGLDVLKELLASAGFGIDQINELIDDLKTSDTGKNIAVDELMNKLASLSDEVNNSDEIEAPEEEVFLPISAIAFIESIMISLGMPEDVRNTILSDVKTDHGIDLNILIKNLKEFEQKSFASQTYFKTDINNNIIAKLMNPLNFGNSGSFSNGASVFTDDKLSLQGFINILENKRKEILSVQINKNGSIENILTKRVNFDGKEILFANSIKTLKSETGQKSALSMSGLNGADANEEKKISGLVDNILKSNQGIKTLKSGAGQNSSLLISGLNGTDTDEEKKISGLVDNLLKSITRQETNNDKIVNVPLNKLSIKDIEKLFSFHINGESGKDAQITGKSELEEKFARLLGKLGSNMSNMNGKNDSDSRNFFQKGQHQTSSLKMSDSSQAGNGEGKILNSVRYLGIAKKEAARTLPSYVTNQIGRGIARAVNQGQSEIRIQLKPPELGRMMIMIEDMGNGVKVSVVAENQTARDILLSNANNLKAALASSGISLENFDVDMGSDFNRSMADTKNQAGYSKNKKGQKNQGIDG